MPSTRLRQVPDVVRSKTAKLITEVTENGRAELNITVLQQVQNFGPVVKR